MKQTLITLVISLLSIFSCYGQGFYAGLEGARLFGDEWCTNWEIGAFASYSHRTSSRFGLEAQAGLYTQIYDDAPVHWLGGRPDDRANTFGGKIAWCGFLRVRWQSLQDPSVHTISIKKERSVRAVSDLIFLFIMPNFSGA